MIKIKSVTKRYGNTPALADTTLSVAPGETLGLVGPNGSGKSTLLGIMAGLIEPDTGDVQLNGFSLSSERAQALQQVQGLLQGTVQLQQELSVIENMPEPTQAEGLLRELDLWEHRDEPVKHISYGMQQTVALARVLGAHAPILLLDEPLSTLDRTTAQRASRLISRLVQDAGRTMVIAAANPRLVYELCTRAVVMARGSIATDIAISRRLSLSQSTGYQLRVKGGLDERWMTWFDGLQITSQEDETIITGTVPDQPALHSLLAKIRDLGLPLVSVRQFDPALEDAQEQLG